MAILEHLIEEIGALCNETNHRATLRIFNILDSNRKLFLEKIDKDIFNLILKNFEHLSEIHSREYGTENYKNEYRRYYENLRFHLNKIL
jgi:hypothetical protein